MFGLMSRKGEMPGRKQSNARANPGAYPVKCPGFLAKTAKSQGKSQGIPCQMPRLFGESEKRLQPCQNLKGSGASHEFKLFFTFEGDNPQRTKDIINIVKKSLEKGSGMKKLTAVILVSAMALSLAGCSSGKGGKVTDRPDRLQSTLESKPEYAEPVFIDETTAQTTQETEPSESALATSETTVVPTSAPAGFSFGKASDYVIDVRSEFMHLENEGIYHVPRVLLNSSYAEEMQLEVEHCFAVYDTEIEEYGEAHYSSTDYAAYLTEGGILSVVFVEHGMWDDDIYHVWNFDVVTGNRVDNRTIAEVAGIQDIRTAAMDAVQAYYNRTGVFSVENYEKVTPDFEYVDQAVENSFSEENLNDDMPIGLRDDGSIFFITEIASIAGAEWYYHMIDAGGADLYNDPAWV